MNFQMASIYLTHKCNLRCPYCFEQFEGKDITPAILQQSLDFIYQRNSTRELVIYGGEPLLRPDLMEEIFKHHKRINNCYSGQIMTNLQLLTPEIAKMLYRYRKYYNCVVVSVDGLTGYPKSLDKIQDQLQLLVDYGIKFVIQTMITSNTLDSLYDSVKEFIKYPASNIVLRYTCGCNQFDSDSDIDKCKDICTRIFNDFRDPRITYFKRLTNQSVFIPDIHLDQQYCSGYVENGNPSIAIDTDGTCYMCEHSLDKKVNSIGNIIEGVDYDKAGIPDDFEVTPTTCFFFDNKCNEYLNKTIYEFRTFMKDALQEEVTLNLSESTDSLYKVITDLAKADEENKAIVNLQLLIKEDVNKDKIKDFLYFLQNLSFSSNLTLNIEVEDHAGIF